jgi:hypothetical protein
LKKEGNLSFLHFFSFDNKIIRILHSDLGQQSFFLTSFHLNLSYVCTTSSHAELSSDTEGAHQLLARFIKMGEAGAGL